MYYVLCIHKHNECFHGAMPVHVNITEDLLSTRYQSFPYCYAISCSNRTFLVSGASLFNEVYPFLPQTQDTFAYTLAKQSHDL